MKRILLALIALTLLAGCLTTNLDNEDQQHPGKFATAWTGKHESLIVAAFGPPTKETTDGKGGHILIWRPRGVSNLRECQAWVNPDGVIYRTSWASY